MNNDIAEGKWKQVIGKAKTAWGELTDDELRKAEGRADRLAGLIQERYGKTRDEAEREVRRFFDDHRNDLF
ncbi:MAG: CsbD family protein [Paraburkholderia sp.]|nr:CsbD family protein [Paraburkholderia sp.]